MVTSDSCARRATTFCMAVRHRGSVKPPARLSRAAGSSTTGFSPAAFHLRRLSARVWAEQRTPSAASRADIAAHRWASVVSGPNPRACSLRPGARPVSISTMRACHSAASSSRPSCRPHPSRAVPSAAGAPPPLRTVKSSAPTSHRYDTARGASSLSRGSSVTCAPCHATTSHSRSCQRTHAPIDSDPASRPSPDPAMRPPPRHQAVQAMASGSSGCARSNSSRRCHSIR
jgi:hypothetical protein